jgi:hypothetical protein
MVLLEMGIIVEVSAGIPQVAILLESKYVPGSNMLS